MNTIEMDVFAKYKKEIQSLKAANEELHRINLELERRLEDLHGEYMLLRYQYRGMPTRAELLKLREEMLNLKKELQLCKWSDRR